MKTYFLELDENELHVIRAIIEYALKMPLHISLRFIAEGIKSRVDKLLEGI